MKQHMSDDQYQHSSNAQRVSSNSIPAYLLGLFCGAIPLLFFALALLIRTDESALVPFIVGIVLQFLAALLMLPLALLERTRPIAYGLFIPLLFAVCLEIFGPFSLQPITPCSAVLQLLVAIILFVSWMRR